MYASSCLRNSSSIHPQSPSSLDSLPSRSFGGTFTSVQKGTTAVLASNVAIYGGTSWGKLLQTCSLDGAVNAVGYTPNYGTWFGGAFTACGTTTLNRVAT